MIGSRGAFGALLSLPLLLQPPPDLYAQDAAAWNQPRALDLIARARARRAEPLADSLLRNYQAKAAGMVYFYLDRRESDERTLVKSDQIALEVFWGAPDRTKQRIVGMRGENALPNRMYYHIDHLTIVQNEFADVIRLGDGDEVHDVPHPAAPGADTIYEYRLSDSLTIRLPGAPEPVRAYQLDVRPRRTDRSAFVGSVFVDRATGDIVRMTFTFTPASYVDRRLDYINISLDNSLWDGRYWLPHEQAVEIRRQLPELDFVAGAVIQARFRVTDYDFNVDLPPNFFVGNPVVAAPRAERESYAFEQALYDDLLEVGLATPSQMRELRAQASALLRRRALSGLPRLRLSLPGASSALRYNRAEGAFVGTGLSFVPGPRFRAELGAGYAFGAEHVSLSLGARLEPQEGLRLRPMLYLNDLRDLGVRPGMPGALNTITSFSVGHDFLDPFYASGGAINLERRVGPLWSAAVHLTGERHESAERVASTVVFDDAAAFRPVLPIDEGELFSARVELRRAVPEADRTGLGGLFSLETGSFDSRFFTSPLAEVTIRRRSLDLRTAARLRAAGGLVLGTPATQHLFLLGGRETLPGYDYRSFAGDVFALTDLELSRTLAAPWIGGRLTAALGWAGWVEDPPADPSSARTGEPAWTAWNTTTTRGVRTSAGLGISAFYDLLRADLVRGLSRGGRWQFIVSLHPDLWSML